MGVLASAKKKYRKLILAAGGRYDRLVSAGGGEEVRQAGECRRVEGGRYDRLVSAGGGEGGTTGW